MVLTNAQTTAFFTEATQTAIPTGTLARMEQEVIKTVDDLGEFQKASLKQVVDNLRNPGGKIPNPDPNAAQGATIPTPPFTFGAKSLLRMTITCDIVRYYKTVGQALTAANI